MGHSRLRGALRRPACIALSTRQSYELRKCTPTAGPYGDAVVQGLVPVFRPQGAGLRPVQSGPRRLCRYPKAMLSVRSPNVLASPQLRATWTQLIMSLSATVRLSGKYQRKVIS